MAKPINKKFFGSNNNKNIKVQFHNGISSVPGFIVKQQGSKKFLCQDKDGNQASCFLVPKKHDKLLPNEMSITVKDKDGNVYQTSKISGKTLTANGLIAVWLFIVPGIGEVQIEESGEDELLTNCDDFEGDETIDDDELGPFAAVFLGTNSYLTFGAGSTQYSSLSNINPPLSKIFVAAGDNSMQVIRWKTFGTAPNRVFIARYEGTNSTDGAYGESNMIFEYRFEEQYPEKFKIYCIENARYYSTQIGLTDVCDQSGYLNIGYWSLNGPEPGTGKVLYPGEGYASDSIPFEPTDPELLTKSIIFDYEYLEDNNLPEPTSNETLYFNEDDGFVQLRISWPVIFNGVTY